MKKIVILSYVLTSACGTWVGSPKKPKGDGDGTKPTEIVATPDPTKLRLSGLLPAGLHLEGGDATEVVAVSTDGLGSVAAPIEDGTFAIDIDKAKTWNVMLVNPQAVGIAMLVARLTSDTLDTVPPLADAAGSLDLAGITVDSDAKTAAAALPRADLLTGLGLTEDGAAFFGGLDDVSRRYANPDIDSDGVVDAVQENAKFSLDFHCRFDLQAGASKHAIVSDMTGTFLPETTVVAYSSASPILTLLDSYLGGKEVLEYSYTFERDAVTSGFDGMTPVTRQAKAGEPLVLKVDQSQDSNGEQRSFGVDFSAPNVPPSGTYVIGVNDKKLTFANILVPDFAVEQIHLLPFIRFNLNADRTIASIDWEWRKLVTEGERKVWRQATAEEIELVSGDKGGYLSLYAADDAGNRLEKNIGFFITREPTGSIVWPDSPAANYQGITKAEAQALDIDHIAGPGLSYDDKLGMRIFANIGARLQK